MVLFMRLGFAVYAPVLDRMADVAGKCSFGQTIYGGLSVLPAVTRATAMPQFWTPSNQRLQE